MTPAETTRNRAAELMHFFNNHPAVAEVARRAIAARVTRVSPEQVEASRSLKAAAIEYISQGEFDGERFMESLAAQWARQSRLSDKQYAGALNHMIAQYQFASRKVGDTGTAPMPEEQNPGAVPPNGIYTVVIGDERRTLRIKDSDMPDSQPGTRVIQYLGGSDNEGDYYGYAFLTPEGQYKIWKKNKTPGMETIRRAVHFLVTGQREDWEAAGKAYAMASGRCWRCNRTLTTPESIERGVGPDCATK